MIFKGDNLFKALINNTLNNRFLNQWRKDFLSEVFILFLCIKGRINFAQIERYGLFTEQRYRQQFEKPFDFMEFNTNITTQHR